MDLVKSQYRHLFSGKESDFPYFCEIFEARMFILKLHSVLEGTAKSADYVPKDADPNDAATKEAAKKKLDEAEAQVYYELMMHLDKKTALLIRPYKQQGSTAWKALVRKFKSSEKPRVFQLTQQLTNLKMSNETVEDYIVRAETLLGDLRGADQTISDDVFQTLLLNGLTKTFDPIVTLVNFSNEDLEYEDLK